MMDHDGNDQKDGSTSALSPLRCYVRKTSFEMQKEKGNQKIMILALNFGGVHDPFRLICSMVVLVVMS
jgi:hypothetical protein